MVKICLDAGHGINTPGKRCLKSIDPNETREWWLNNRVANYVEDGLTEYEGYKLLRVDDRTGKTDVARRTRTDKANNWKADIYVSIHHNAGINGGSGGGIVVYRYTNSSKFTKAMQKRLYDLLIKHTGLKGNRASPLAEAKFDVISWTTMPAVLIEGGFMDSKVDTPIILTDKHARGYAKAVVEFLATEYKLKKKATANTSTALRKGDKGDLVKKLQIDLISLGFKMDPYGVDGSYGLKTKEAVTLFQKKYKLKIDGIAGPETQGKIKDLLAELNKPNTTPKPTNKVLYRVIIDSKQIGAYAELDNIIDQIKICYGKAKEILIQRV
ncbi:MAG TPA: N-acetylmuramoyl-L-alanine amidase [Tissierellaceae bacterium]|nr:N-acetylmuramoyl-L-alanine amidase [Tissierellaceae bacterium]